MTYFQQTFHISMYLNTYKYVEHFSGTMNSAIIYKNSPEIERKKYINFFINTNILNSI